MELHEVTFAFTVSDYIAVDVLCCFLLQVRILLAYLGMGFQVVTESEVAIDVRIAGFEGVEVMCAVISTFLKIATTFDAVFALCDIADVDELCGLSFKRFNIRDF